MSAACRKQRVGLGNPFDQMSPARALALAHILVDNPHITLETIRINPALLVEHGIIPPLRPAPLPDPEFAERAHSIELDNAVPLHIALHAPGGLLANELDAAGLGATDFANILSELLSNKDPTHVLDSYEVCLCASHGIDYCGRLNRFSPRYKGRRHCSRCRCCCPP